MGGPKFRAFFPSPTTIPLFSCLSGCLLVEFWWCFDATTPEMCTFGVGLCCLGFGLGKSTLEIGNLAPSSPSVFGCKHYQTGVSSVPASSGQVLSFFPSCLFHSSTVVVGDPPSCSPIPLEGRHQRSVCGKLGSVKEGHPVHDNLQPPCVCWIRSSMSRFLTMTFVETHPT